MAKSAAIKFTITGLESTLKSIKRVFENVKKQNQMYNEIRDFIIQRVQQQTRAGRDLTREGARQPALSSKYIAYRQRLLSTKSKSKILPAKKYFRPSFSNLTLTGQLMKSITGRLNKAKGIITIFPDGTRDDGKTNKEVTKNLKDMGRTYLGLDDRGRARVQQIVLRELRRQIRSRRK